MPAGPPGGIGGKVDGADAAGNGVALPDIRIFSVEATLSNAVWKGHCTGTADSEPYTLAYTRGYFESNSDGDGGR